MGKSSCRQWGGVIVAERAAITDTNGVELHRFEKSSLEIEAGANLTVARSLILPASLGPGIYELVEELGYFRVRDVLRRRVARLLVVP